MRGSAAARVVSRILLAASVLAFVLLRLPYLSVPLERDEGEYAYLAQRLLLGEMPYRDAFDQKPPAIFLAYAAAFALGGTSVEAIHALLAIWSAGTALALFALVRRLADPPAAGFAALIFCVASSDPVLDATAANTELFLLLPMVASWLAMLRGLEGGRLRSWLAAGALAAAACWFKPVAASSAVALAVCAAAELRARPLAAAARAGLGLGLGAVACSLPLVVWLAAGGAWPAFVDAVIVHNLEYARTLSARESAANLGHQLGLQAPSFAVVWALAALGLARPSAAPRRSRLLLAAWLLACLLGASAGRFFRAHYFVPLLPPLCALAGLGCGALLRPRLARGAGLAGLAGLLLAIAAPSVAARWATLTAGSPEAIARQIYGLNPFPEAVRIAEFVRRASGDGDRVLVVGSEPQILFYAARRSATRFIFFYPLTAGGARALERQRQALEEVRAHPPGHVVWINLAPSLGLEPRVDAPILAALADWLAREYRLELVAEPGPGEPAYRFSVGAGARRLAQEAGAAWHERAWLAVYRRRA